MYTPNKINTNGKHTFPYFLNIIPVNLLFAKKSTITDQTATIIKNIITVNISSFKLREANNGT